MKINRILAAALLASTAAGPALAADLPSRKAPVVFATPAPIFTWTGFYIGLNAGYGWSNANNTTVGIPGGFDPGPGYIPGGPTSAGMASSVPFLSATPSGFIGGGQIGYNWQFGSLVAGLETDIQFANMKSTRSGASAFTPVNLPTLPFGTVAQVSNKLDYLGTVRARLGFTVTPTFLVYATGGLAYGGVRTGVSSLDTTLAPSAGITTVSAANVSSSSTRVGWTIGGGAEFALSQNWSIKGEYLYYDLGKQSVATNAAYIETTGLGTGVGSPYASAFRNTTSRWKGSVVRIGVNYRFAWGSAAPVVARY